MEFERNTEILKETLKNLAKLGYTELHLPGGTSKDGSFSSTVVAPYYDAVTKIVYFCCVPYIPGKKDQNGHTKKLGESPVETARRELLEETALQGNVEDFKLIYSFPVKDNRPGYEGKFHIKYFYLIQKFTGTLFDFEGPNPIDSETAAPVMIPASMLEEYLFKGHYFHIAKRAIEELMSQNAEYAMALMNLV